MEVSLIASGRNRRTGGAVFHVVRESKLSLKREVEITILRNEAEIKKKSDYIISMKKLPKIYFRKKEVEPRKQKPI